MLEDRRLSASARRCSSLDWGSVESNLGNQMSSDDAGDAPCRSGDEEVDKDGKRWWRRFGTKKEVMASVSESATNQDHQDRLEGPHHRTNQYHLDRRVSAAARRSTSSLSQTARRCSIIEWDSIKSNGLLVDWSSIRKNSDATEETGSTNGKAEFGKDRKPWWRLSNKKGSSVSESAGSRDGSAQGSTKGDKKVVKGGKLW